jgi:PKD repeat protein
LVILVSLIFLIPNIIADKPNLDEIIYVDAGGPYIGYANNTIQFNGDATGGSIPYLWYWKFGDGKTSAYQNPTNMYKKPGNYVAILTVTDSSELYNSANDTAQVIVYNEDFALPIVKITKPKNAIYILNEEIEKFFTPIIFGIIDIEVNAYDNGSGISSVNFYTGQYYQLLKYSDDKQPYIWRWDETQFGWRTIKIVVYDKADNKSEVEIVVWKFF